MKRTVAEKLIADHLLEGDLEPGSEIGLRIDQTLTQDATGTLVMLELEAMQVDRVQTEVSAQYVDHNLLQTDFKNADDHLFLRSAAQRFGLWYSRPGNGVSHPLHMAHFGRPGATLLGSDSHTCAAGSLGMLAIGAGGLEVALAMTGAPFYVQVPEVWGIELTGELPPGVSAKDVILELLRRHDVDGGVGRVIEYFGPGLECLTAMDRHVIANMGAELGATTSVFPSDDAVRRFLNQRGRADDYVELRADAGCTYAHHDHIDLSALEPLIACPSSPGNVVPVREVAGRPIYQAYIGSSANPGLRDLAVAAAMVDGRQVPAHVSFDLNPATREMVAALARDGDLTRLLASGARLHQTGCNGCIGMGQAPATGRISLRTVPRNFPGRSGTLEDAVYLCSPETATASALRGAITDPRDLDRPVARVDPAPPEVDRSLLLAPPEDGRDVELIKGPNIVSLPDLEPLPDDLTVPVLLVTGDDVSTDEILPAGAAVLPLRSNIEKIAEHAFRPLCADYAAQARALDAGRHAVVGGANYGQGSSREHAALAPRVLGLRVVLAQSFARIHWQNLVNFGVLPLTFADPEDADPLAPGDVLRLTDLRAAVANGQQVQVEVGGRTLQARHALSGRQVDVLLAGGLINWRRARLAGCSVGVRHHKQT